MSTHADFNMPSLFDAPDANTDGTLVPTRLHENGVIYLPAFLTTRECNDLLAKIDARPWMNDLKRRVQHYGWRYDYSSRVVTEEMKTEPLPGFILKIARELNVRGWFASIPDQVIVNEYEPGQGIAPHIDRDCFGPSVATLSLGDRWPMQFTPLGRSAVATESEEIFLDVGSMLILQGDARTRWMHGIVKRRTDGQGRSRRQRMRRVSVTFRTVELQPRRL